MAESKVGRTPYPAVLAATTVVNLAVFRHVTREDESVRVKSSGEEVNEDSVTSGPTNIDPAPSMASGKKERLASCNKRVAFVLAREN